MADSIAIDPDKVLAHLRRRHTQQLDDATFEVAQLRAALEALQGEVKRLEDRNLELADQAASRPDGRSGTTAGTPTSESPTM
jgi:phage shock protein A